MGLSILIASIVIIISPIRAAPQNWGSFPELSFSTGGIYSIRDLQDAVRMNPFLQFQNQDNTGFTIRSPYDNHDDHRRRRRSTATTSHSNHFHTRKGKCFDFGGSNSFNGFQPRPPVYDLPIFDLDPKYDQVPMPYNVLRTGQQQTQNPMPNKGPEPDNKFGPFPFAYRIVGPK